MGECEEAWTRPQAGLHGQYREAAGAMGLSSQWGEGVESEKSDEAERESDCGAGVA